jgi:uncharacterized membrane protein YhaH (DUF805 family)
MHCKKFGISLNPSKSIFDVTKGKLLGHIVSDLEIIIYPERITMILNLPSPTSKKEVQAFMGIINFVCRFVPNFVVMVKPIHNLLKQDHFFLGQMTSSMLSLGLKKQSVMHQFWQN